MIPEVQKLVAQFAATLEGAIVERINARLKDALNISLVGVPSSERTTARLLATTRKPDPARRKGPIQTCPHPGCVARSAPVFSMMCAKHKDDPKRLVKKWREARRARKAGAR